ncbi:MAG: alkyl hydroperoxide reductase subunit F [Propionibacterium sp.]|nr:alkyl hydroperoxide reductase subunit F [Propionibacterium sp.]
MLDPTLTTQLRTYLGYVTRPVELRAATDSSTTGQRMSELLGEIAALSDQVSLVEEDAHVVRRPSFLITNPGQDTGLRFAGVPLGHEFTSLVLALLQVGGHPSTEDPALQQRARELTGPLHFETFFSLSCQNCPTVVQALDLMAVLNPQVTHTAIEGSAFEAEAEERGIRSVPTVFLNGEPFGQGRMSLEKILDKVAPLAPEDRSDTPTIPAEHDVLVIGGGPAGATAAIYTARKGLSTALVAERMGGQVLDTAAIENLPSLTRVEGPAYGQQLETHVREYEVDVLPDHRAVALEPAADDSPLAAVVRLEDGTELAARTVVLATGAHWRQLGVPGEEEYRNKGVTYCPHCDGPLFKGKRVAVIGGGNSGIEAAIDLAGVAAHVDVVEFDTKLRADEVLLHTLGTLGNVDVHVNAATQEVLGDGRGVTGLRVADRESGAESTLPLDGVFVQIGLLPNTGWLKGSVDLTPRGEIVVDESLRTSVEGVYAAGDCTTSRYKQIVVAAGEGAQAALGAFDHLIRTVA